MALLYRYILFYFCFGMGIDNYKLFSLKFLQVTINICSYLQLLFTFYYSQLFKIINLYTEAYKYVCFIVLFYFIFALD